MTTAADPHDDTREVWDPQTQTIDPETLEKTALEGLRREWGRVWDQPIPFYREKFEAAGLGPDEMPDLDDIPTTTKAELREDQDRHPPFGTHRGLSLSDAARVAVTTGTTGTPWMIFYSRTDLDRMVELQYQHTWRVGLRAGDHFAHSWPGGLYPSGVLGGRHMLELGILEIPVGPPFSVDQAADHIRVWQTLGFDALMCTASQLQIYEQAAAERGLDVAELLRGKTLVFLEASCQFDEPRRRVEEAYGLERLHNISGAAEVVGLVTSDCRFHTGLHIPSSNYHIAACDPATGRRVLPGERGTLVVSIWGFDNFFLRYDLEDIIVETVDPCPCGQTGPRYALIGRAADRAVVGGRMILPLDVQLALERHGAPEFLVTPGESEVLRVKVESDGREQEIESTLRGELQCPVEVERVAVGTFPRSTFKPRRVGA